MNLWYCSRRTLANFLDFPPFWISFSWRISVFILWFCSDIFLNFRGIERGQEKLETRSMIHILARICLPTISDNDQPWFQIPGTLKRATPPKHQTPPKIDYARTVQNLQEKLSKVNSASRKSSLALSQGGSSVAAFTNDSNHATPG